MDIASLIRDACAIFVQVGTIDVMTGKSKAGCGAFKLAAKLAIRASSRRLNLSKQIVDQRTSFRS
jgi:hypothetical protein